MSDIYLWLTNNYEEMLGVIFSLAYLYYSIKQNIWLWFWGLMASTIYAHIFFKYAIYADMGLQVYYVLFSIYGWYLWNFANVKNNKTEKPKIQSIRKKGAIVLVIITSGLFLAMSQFLIYFSDSGIPYWDAFTTAASITATWMLAKKYIEHWLIWIVVDLISLGLYFYKGLYFTIFLYFVYASMAVVGYLQWKKDILGSGGK